jgi:hypothetical protein
MWKHVFPLGSTNYLSIGDSSCNQHVVRGWVPLHSCWLPRTLEFTIEPHFALHRRPFVSPVMIPRHPPIALVLWLRVLKFTFVTGWGRCIEVKESHRSVRRKMCSKYSNQITTDAYFDQFQENVWSTKWSLYGTLTSQYSGSPLPTEHTLCRSLFI